MQNTLYTKLGAKSMNRKKGLDIPADDLVKPIYYCTALILLATTWAYVLMIRMFLKVFSPTRF